MSADHRVEFHQKIQESARAKTWQIKEPLNAPTATATEYGETQNDTHLQELFNAIFAENVDTDFHNGDST